MTIPLVFVREIVFLGPRNCRRGTWKDTKRHSVERATGAYHFGPVDLQQKKKNKKKKTKKKKKKKKKKKRKKRKKEKMKEKKKRKEK